MVVKDTTVAKDIRLLATQLEKAYEDNNFKEWISTTLVMTKRIFSEQDELVRSLQQIQNQSLDDTYARIGSRAILHALIDTLRYQDHFNHAHPQPPRKKQADSFLGEAIRAYVTSEQWQRLAAVVDSSAAEEIQYEQLTRQLSELSSPTLAQIIARLFINQA